MRSINVTREFNRIALLQRQHILKAPPNLHQDILALLRAPALATSRVAIAATGERLTRALRPQTDTVEALAHVDDHAHDLAVVLVLERLADGGQHDVQPQVVDVDQLLVAEGVGPFAAVLVVGVLPLGADAGFEEVVVGLLGELLGGRDVVL